jgi:ubiquinone/menaquinone biosynthesis C-methylase UbiE
MFSEDRPQLVLSHSGTNRDQRKHIRMEHSGSVQLVGEGRRFTGQAVNISRTGMQIVVNLPDSYESVRSITFTLPNTEHTIELPCRIVRSGTENGSSRPEVFGLEFSYQGEAQLLLIENYIRDLKQKQLTRITRDREMRRVYRAPCSLCDISTDRKDVRIDSIDNISTGGLLVSFSGELKPEETICVSFCLPGDPRTLQLQGQVMYVIHSTFRDLSTAGIRLQNMAQTTRARIRSFVIEATSGSTVRQLHEILASRDLDPNYQISDPQEIAAIFLMLYAGTTRFNVLFDLSFEMHSMSYRGISEAEHLFFASRPKKLDLPPDVPQPNAYFSFYLAEGSYYFKTELVRSSDQRLCFRFPEVIYRSEKRSYQRKVLELQSEVDLKITSGDGATLRYKGRLVDISWRGFLCELPLNDQTRSAFKRGTYVEYLINEQFGLDHHGMVRHLTTELDVRGNQTLRVGIEAGIQHSGFKYRQFTQTEWDRHKTPLNSNPLAERIDTLPIHYTNQKNQEIAALLNATRLPVTAPVVLIPPAFGKKKEALSPLVLTLLQNFKRKGKDLVILRYDGINRPGESYSDDKNPERGTEMLHYRLSQGLSDLRTSLGYVHNNPFFTPQEVILITFSMSSIDARKLLMDGQGHLVDYWISCMGIPSAKTTIGNILGGIDIIGNFKMGVQTGRGGMLGYLVDFDTLAEDLIENKYAYLTDSRNDMSKVPHPVLWIYGTHDRWTDIKEVHDLMAVKSAGKREVIEIPTGHNLRSSADAITTFKLMTSYLYEQLFGEPLDVSSPDKEEMVRLIAYERERLGFAKDLDREHYWKNYLLGVGRNSLGYDFYRNIDGFRRFLDLEANLLNPGTAERIADMGCGTGLLIEVILQHLLSSKAAGESVEIVAVDLVEGALAKTRRKWENLCKRHPQLDNHSLRLIKADLEPNRLLPIKKLIENPHLGFDFLRNRIEGLRNTTVDLLKQKCSLELIEIIRGCDMTQEKRRFLEERLKDGHRSAVIDLNRAARFIKRKLTTEDLIDRGGGSNRPVPHELYETLSCQDLRFDKLNFGKVSQYSQQTFPDRYFDKIAASLFISYVYNPDLILQEFYRMLRSGGLLLVSSMKPDSDISTLFTDYINTVQSSNPTSGTGEEREDNLAAARAMLNEAAALFTLEEDGYFRFYAEEELAAMFKAAGFVDIQTYRSLGDPEQAVIVTGKKSD